MGSASPLAPVDNYEHLLDALPGHDVPWLRARRESAVVRFAERGYPTPRDEAWKYTNVAPLVKRMLRPAPGGAVSPADLASFLFPDAEMYRLVFVDGRLVPGLSVLAGLPQGVTVTGLAKAIGQDAAALGPYLDRDPPAEPQGFVELNTALMTDGACLMLAPGTALDRPLHVLHISTAAEPAASHLRNLLIGGRESRAVVVEHYVSLGGGDCLTNAVTQCHLDDQAVIEHYRLGEEGDGTCHIAGVHVSQGRGSRYTSHNVTAGGRLVRNDLSVVLDGEGGECRLNGLYLTQRRQHVDNHTRIEHRVPRCLSREWYKGVLDGSSRGVFTGHVVVRPPAQRTDAEQANHNLLLSDDAEADSRPQLEIYADDVQCRHGATVGRLDQDVLFYLRARGLDERRARRMLIAAFAGDVLERLALAPLRRRLEGVLAARLMG